MARISLSGGFVVCPAGSHVFRIYGVEYEEEFGNLTIHMINAQGITHKEVFHLLDANDEPNQGAMNAFSFFAKNAMNDFVLEDVDPMDLVGHYIGVEIVHHQVESKKPGQEGKMLTFANLGDKWPADGFDVTPVPAALTKTLDDKDRARSKRKEKTATTAAPAPAPAETAQAPVATPPALNLDELLG